MAAHRRSAANVLLVLAILCLAVHHAWAQTPKPANCLVNAGSKMIDLSKIPAKSLKIQQHYGGATTMHVFKFSLCQATREAPTGYQDCNANAFIGEWATDGSCEAQFDTVMQQPTYVNGLISIQYYNNNAWSGAIELKCGTSDLGSTADVEVTPMLQFTFHLESGWACLDPKPPKSDDDNGGGLGGGGAFILILSLAVIFYVGGMVAFAYFKEDKRGRDLIPHAEFWSSIPGLVKEGCVFTVSKVKGLVTGGSGGGYSGGGGATVATGSYGSA